MQPRSGEEIHMKLVPFRSVAGALRVAAGVAAVFAMLVSGKALSEEQGQRWNIALEKLKSASVNDLLPAFAKRAKPIRLKQIYPLTVRSNGVDIPAYLFSTPDCALAPGNRDIDCEHPQGPNALAFAVLPLSKHSDRKSGLLPSSLMIVPQGAASAHGGPGATKDLRTLTSANGQGPLSEDKFVWIPIDNQQYGRLAPAGIVFCLDECDASSPLYTLNDAQTGDIAPGTAAGNSGRLDPQGKPPGGFGDLPLPPAATAAPGQNQGSTAPTQSEITVTVQNVPPKYDDKIVFRLVLSAVRMRDGTSSSDIVSIANLPPASATAQQRAVVLTVKGSAVEGLTVAGKKGDCATYARCDINMALHQRYVDSKAGASPRFFATVRPATGPGAETLEYFYKRLKLINVELPRLTEGALPGYSIVYLPDDSYFQIAFKAAGQNLDAFTEIPRWDAPDKSNLLRLTVPPRGLGPTVIAVDDPSLPSTEAAGAKPQAIAGPSAGAAPAPVASSTSTSAPAAGGDRTATGSNPSASSGTPPPGTAPAAATSLTPATPPAAPAAPVQALPLHYVMKPSADVPAGWNQARLAKRLLDLMRGPGFSLKDGETTTESKPLLPEMTASGDAVVVWSGTRPPNVVEWTVPAIDGVEFVPPAQPLQPAPPAWTGGRIRQNDAVATGEFKIKPAFLYDQWQVGIEAVRRVNGQEVPDSANDLCTFTLTFSGANNPVRLRRTEHAGKRMLLSEPIPQKSFAKLVDLPAKLEVQTSNDANADCAGQHYDDLGRVAGWNTSEAPGSPSAGRMETRLSLEIRGRWLLGLYGPQSIGAGITNASEGSISDVKDVIIDSLVRFLYDTRRSDFQDGQPVARAVGYDLALMTDAGAGSFAEGTVLAGGYRQPKTNDVRLDPEGERRFKAFLDGATSSGSAPELRQVGERIKRYSDLFGKLSGERHPMAIYVGAAPSLLNLCSSWKEMTREVADSSGTPRVHGIVFTSRNSGQLDEQLERTGRGPVKSLGLRVRGLSCEGENGSMLLVVSFPDLLSRPPETVMGPAFEVVKKWAESAD
jgi:hypothetical protein